jgi:type VI secretion system protein ImpH
MAAKKRKPDSVLKQQLSDRFYEFSFYRAVHLLERFSEKGKKLGGTLVPSEEPVRFSVKKGMSFPPSDISDFSLDEPARTPRMEVAFLGLTGPSGVLPHWYTQLILERDPEKRTTALAAFLDMFNHRLISLFYLAWKKHRFPENYQPGGRDRLSRYLLSLSGLATPGLTEMIGLPEEALTFYSGLLSRPIASAIAIEAAVAYFAKHGCGSSSLSNGSSMWSHRIRRSWVLPMPPLVMTPFAAVRCGSARLNFASTSVGKDKFTRLMPTGDLLVPIFSLVRYMVGIEYEFEIRIYLRKSDVPLCQLGSTDSDAPLLGWTTWVSSPGYKYENDIFFTFQEYDLKLVKF